MPEKFESSPEKTKIEVVIEELKKIEHFEAYGEIYRHDTDGGRIDITRAEAVRGGNLQEELEGGQSITVFADLRAGDLKAFEGAMNNRLRTEKDDAVYIVEVQPDGRMKVVGGISDVVDPEKLQLTIVRKGKVVESRPATLVPKNGLNYFSTRKSVMGEESEGVVERRLGGQITNVDYKK